jgi:hypothetical protein
MLKRETCENIHDRIAHLLGVWEGFLEEVTDTAP